VAVVDAAATTVGGPVLGQVATGSVRVSACVGGY